MTPVAHFKALDYGVFLIYLVASVAVGLLFKEQKNLKEYLLAGRSMSALVVAISVLAALFSGISYLGGPAEVYSHGIGLMWLGLSFFIATPITAWIFLPFFYKSRFYTAYQYLEERFSVQVRTITSALFIIRVLIWLAIAIYAPALALEQVTHLPLWFTIICTGALTTWYTTLGGLKAVIWTDVMQFIVLFGGQVLILVVALLKIPDGFSGAYHIAHDAGRLHTSWSLDPTMRVTMWGVILGGAFTNLVQIATDQVSVQRYLTATSLKEARRSLWIKLALLLPVVFVFSSTGVALFAFYQIHGDPVAAGKISTADQILPYFVINELPYGLPGLLIAAIFAATMSTISAGLNALTSASLVDFYQRLGKTKQTSDQQQLRLAKNMTLIYGVLVIGLAFVVQKLGTLAEASTKAVGLVGGPILGIFLLGMLSKRANSRGVLIGAACGFLALLPICFYNEFRNLLSHFGVSGLPKKFEVSFLWYSTVGCVVTILVGWITSFGGSGKTPQQFEAMKREDIEPMEKSV